MASFITKLVDGTYEILKSVVTSAGAADSGKPVVLDAAGKFDLSVLPDAIGNLTETIQATEDLAAGDFVNIYEPSVGVDRVRKADATDQTKYATGFVIAAVTTGNNAEVFRAGLNTALTVTTGAQYYLSDTTAGAATETAPAENSGSFQQVLGIGTPEGLEFTYRHPINFP